MKIIAEDFRKKMKSDDGNKYKVKKWANTEVWIKSYVINKDAAGIVTTRYGLVVPAVIFPDVTVPEAGMFWRKVINAIMVEKGISDVKASDLVQAEKESVIRNRVKMDLEELKDKVRKKYRLNLTTRVSRTVFIWHVTAKMEDIVIDVDMKCLRGKGKEFDIPDEDKESMFLNCFSLDKKTINMLKYIKNEVKKLTKTYKDHKEWAKYF